MPVKRRKSKVRPDDLLAWQMLFQSGHDYFDDLPTAGIETDNYGRVDRAIAEAAWRRFGDEFMATWQDKYVEPWALEEFGEPRPRGKRRR